MTHRTTARSLVLATLVAAAPAWGAVATNRTWQDNAGANPTQWPNSANWVASNPADTATEQAVFSASATAKTTVIDFSGGATPTIASILFSSSGWSVNQQNAASSLTLVGNDPGTNNTIINNTIGSGTNSIGAKIILGVDSGIISVASGGAVSIGGVIDDGVNTYNLIKQGAGTLTLTGANTYGGTTTVSAGTLALSGGNNRLLTTGAVAFAGTSTLNVGATSQTLASITVPDAASAATTIAGSGGTLIVNGASDLQIGPGGAVGSGLLSTVNMSTLSNFTYNASGNIFRVGLKSGSSNSGALGLVAETTLAANNSITASALRIGDVSASNDGGESRLHLGAANSINVGSILMGVGRADATLDFASGGSSATFRGTAGGSSAVGTWTVGSVQQFAGAAQTSFNATVNLANGTTDAIVTTVNIASAGVGSSSNRAGLITGLFSMGNGTLDVGTMNIGLILGAADGSIGAAFGGAGTFTLNHASGLLDATTINFATNTILSTGAFAKTVSGTLNLTNGTVKATTIQLGAQTGSATGVTAAINWTTGTIQNTDSANLTISGVPINLIAGTHTFDVSGSQTTTVTPTAIIGGVGGLTKTGSGTLILQGNNTFAGNVSTGSAGGIINIQHDNALGLGAKTLQSSSGTAGTFGIELEGGVTIGSNVSWSISNNVNAIRAVSGANTINGTIDMTAGAGDTRVIADLGATLTLANTVSASGGGGRILQLDGAGNGLVSGNIVDGATQTRVAKDGAGTWTLSGNNNYTGTTAVNVGTLLVNGSHTGGGAFNVNGSAVLGGNGSIAAAVTINASATLAPGNSIGQLDFSSNLVLNGTYLVEVSGSLIDQIDVGALLNLSASTDALTIVGTLTDAAYIIADYGTLAGTFNSLNNLQGYTVDYNYLGGNQIALIAPLVVPAPAALPAGLALMALATIRRRRR